MNKSIAPNLIHAIDAEATAQNERWLKRLHFVNWLLKHGKCKTYVMLFSYGGTANLMQGKQKDELAQAKIEYDAEMAKLDSPVLLFNALEWKLR